jgi:hypothetical protein
MLFYIVIDIIVPLLRIGVHLSIDQQGFAKKLRQAGINPTTTEFLYQKTDDRITELGNRNAASGP